MAPQFTTLMYQIYASYQGMDALVCFPISQNNSIFPFRDKLTEAVLKTGGIEVQRTQGYPLPPDSLFRFYPERHSAFLEQILQKNRPGFLSRLMNTAEWVSYQKEEKLIGDVIEVEIETSHDFPCILVHSRIHAEETLSTFLLNVISEIIRFSPS